MVIETILTILYTFIIIVIINKAGFFKIDGVSTKILSGIFILKVLSGTALLLIFTFYYTNHSSSDIFKYFSDGNILYSAIYQNPLDYLRMLTGIDANSEHLREYYTSMNFWFKDFNYDLYNDNRTIIRLSAFFRLFSFGYLNVHNVFMSFLSFIGLVATYKVFMKYFEHKKYLLLVAIFLSPSVLFWSSGALKEGIVVFSLGILFYSFYNIITKNIKTIYIIGIVCGAFILFISKFHVLVATLPGLVFLTWYYFSKKKKYTFIKFITIHLLIILMAFFSKYIISGYDFLKIMSYKQHDFVNMVEETNNTGSYIKIPELQPTAVSLIKNSPGAFLNTFARPHIFEIHNMVSILAAFENLIILSLLVLSLVFYNKNDAKINTGLLLFCLSFTLLLFTLSGLITPVLGALVRYKIPALPFLIIIFVVLIDVKKIELILKRKHNE